MPVDGSPIPILGFPLTWVQLTGPVTFCVWPSMTTLFPTGAAALLLRRSRCWICRSNSRPVPQPQWPRPRFRSKSRDVPRVSFVSSASIRRQAVGSRVRPQSHRSRQSRCRNLKRPSRPASDRPGRFPNCAVSVFVACGARLDVGQLAETADTEDRGQERVRDQPDTFRMRK